MLFSCVGWFFLLCLSLFFYDLGVTPTDVLWGVPLHKSLTKVTFPPDLSASNTKTVQVCFFNMKGQPLDVSEHLAEFQAEAWFQYQAVNAFVSPQEPGASNVVQVGGKKRAKIQKLISVVYIFACFI